MKHAEPCSFRKYLLVPALEWLQPWGRAGRATGRGPASSPAWRQRTALWWGSSAGTWPAWDAAQASCVHYYYYSCVFLLISHIDSSLDWVWLAVEHSVDSRTDWSLVWMFSSDLWQFKNISQSAFKGKLASFNVYIQTVQIRNIVNSNKTFFCLCVMIVASQVF